MNWGKAIVIAEAFKSAIAPYCERAEIAGSVRRKKAEVGDIEIVCIPKMETYDKQDSLFSSSVTERHRKFVKIVDSINILIGDAKTGKYMRRYSGKAQIQFDIFIACPENWGLVYSVRTGSGNFSHHILAAGWEKMGYHSSKHFLYDEKDMEYNEKSKKWVPLVDAKPIRNFYEEEEVFEFLGIDFIEPEKRD